MCEIFPEVYTCCLIISLRIGMLFISILAITTGAITLSVIEKNSDVSYHNLKNVTNIRDPNQAFSELSSLIQSGLTFMSTCFMLMGVLLLFATLGDSEGFVQVFVWIIFVNIVIGFFMVLAIAFECVMESNKCIFGSLDWFSSSVALVTTVAYLFIWFYFISVANSYVLQSTV